jgi:hypothetical protein
MVFLPMHIKKHLGFTGLRKVLSKRFSHLSDHREEEVDHSMHDVFMSAFAMMHFQDPSLLQFERMLQSSKQGNNLTTMFAVESIPSDTQMRDIMDEVDSKELEPLFDDFFRLLQRAQYLEEYRVLDRYYLCVMDGSEYFGSEKIHCPSCLTREIKKKQGNTVRYAHQIMQAAIIHPKESHVIPLPPEEIKNTDGKEKQDCEVNAAKRLLQKIRQSHPKLPFIIIADSLHSKQPTIETIVSLGMRYVLTAKPDDHKKLMEWVDEQRLLKEVMHMEAQDRKGRTHIYEWVNDVPLNDNKKTIIVNYFEYWIKDGSRVAYHNSWVTDFPVDDENVEQLVEIGRSRWMIENEVFNTVKNHGYHIEHNYGHGKKHLSMNFFLLNMLAFFMHQIIELTDRLYQWLRQRLGSKKNLWDHLRIACHILIYPSWEFLLRSIAEDYGYT